MANLIGADRGRDTERERERHIRERERQEIGMNIFFGNVNLSSSVCPI
jgi:hypothetical protein